MTNIEWTDKVWNPVAGCRKVSPGCANCYAETMAKRLAAMGQKVYQQVVDEHGWNGKFIEMPERLAEPLKWRKPARVFVNSMSDLFGEGVSSEYIAAVFGVMAACPQHTFQILTKRPERAVKFFEYLRAAGSRVNPTWGPRQVVSYWALRQPEPLCTAVAEREEIPGDIWPLLNVWLGVSVENQETADARIPLLLQCPAAIRFISAEPLLGEIDLKYPTFNGADSLNKLAGLDWVIVGGESGPGARPCDIAHIRSIVQQCKAAGVPVFVKQLGSKPVEHVADPEAPDPIQDPQTLLDVIKLTDRKGGDPAEWPRDLRVREFPAVAEVRS